MNNEIHYSFFLLRKDLLAQQVKFIGQIKVKSLSNKL